MKTLDALNYYLQIKRLGFFTVKNITAAMNSLNSMYEELPQSSGEIDIWTKHLIESQHLNPSSARLHLHNVKAVYHLMRKKFKINCDFLSDVEPIEVDESEKRYFNAEELALIIASCTSPRDLALIYTFIDSPMRAGEIGSNPGKPEHLLALRGRDIIFYNDSDNILRAKVHVYGKTKEHNYRIDPKIGKMLQSLSGTPDDWVFKDWKDPSKPASARALEFRVHRLLLKAGFTGERLSPHTLRHSSASLVMLMSKGNVSLVDSLLGHKQGSAATKIYLHAYQESLAQSVSPLQLVKDQFALNHPSPASQAALLIDSESSDSNTTSLIITDNNQKVIDNTPDTLIEMMFPTPSENTIIRPVLDYENLMLLKRALMCLTQFGQVVTDSKEAQAFYHRILRNAKKQDQQPTTETTSPELNNEVFFIK